jgi:hypothetical protein
MSAKRVLPGVCGQGHRPAAIGEGAFSITTFSRFEKWENWSLFFRSEDLRP